VTCDVLSPFPEASAFRRDPAEVMRLNRLGQAHPTRLSFLRVLLRRMQAENWTFDRPVFDIDARGVGRAVYRAIGPDQTYSLVAFGHDLPTDMRSDRVIATAWDATFTLCDGTPTSEDLDRLAANVPLQEAGRVSEQAEMLTVWLIRTFTIDLVEQMARLRGGDTAVSLDPALRRSLGVGNSTGLGMAPFLVLHPMLLNNWMMVREESLARVRAQQNAADQAVDGFRSALDAAIDEASEFAVDGTMPIGVLRRLLTDNYAWAFAYDYRTAHDTARFWYCRLICCAANSRSLARRGLTRVRIGGCGSAFFKIAPTRTIWRGKAGYDGQPFSRFSRWRIGERLAFFARSQRAVPARRTGRWLVMGNGRRMRKGCMLVGAARLSMGRYHLGLP